MAQSVPNEQIKKGVTAGSQYDNSSYFVPSRHLSSYRKFVNIIRHPRFVKQNQTLRDVGIDPGPNPAAGPVRLTIQMF